MTPKEAIEILMSDEKLAEIEYYGGFEGQKKVAKLYSEAFDMAIEALEKQIPKKPVYYIFGKEKYPKCPCCGDGWNMNEYGNGMVHCWECGQAIDWSGEE